MKEQSPRFQALKTLVSLAYLIPMLFIGHTASADEGCPGKGWHYTFYGSGKDASCLLQNDCLDRGNYYGIVCSKPIVRWANTQLQKIFQPSPFP